MYKILYYRGALLRNILEPVGILFGYSANDLEADDGEVRVRCRREPGEQILAF